MKTISQRTWSSDQSWHHETTVNVSGKRLRAKIRRNAYDFQSSAVVSLWDGSKWNVVCSRPITECRSAAISYVDKNITDSAFTPDVRSMLDEAMKIIQ